MRCPTRLALVTLVALAVAATTCAAASGAGSRTTQADRPDVVFMTSDCTASNFLCPAFVRAVKRTGARARIVSPDGREDLVGTLSLLARQGHDLVMVDFTFLDALAEAAPRFPRTRFGLVDAPVTWSADIWYTYDGAPQWYFMSNFIPLVAANAAGGTQAATFGYASVDARELSYQFAIRVRESPDAPAGSGNFADLGCHLMVEIGNQQGSIQPYDSAVAVAAMPGGNLQRNR